MRWLHLTIYNEELTYVLIAIAQTNRDGSIYCILLFITLVTLPYFNKKNLQIWQEIKFSPKQAQIKYEIVFNTYLIPEISVIFIITFIIK